MSQLQPDLLIDGVDLVHVRIAAGVGQDVLGLLGNFFAQPVRQDRLGLARTSIAFARSFMTVNWTRPGFCEMPWFGRIPANSATGSLYFAAATKGSAWAECESIAAAAAGAGGFNSRFTNRRPPPIRTISTASVKFTLIQNLALA